MKVGGMLGRAGVQQQAMRGRLERAGVAAPVCARAPCQAEAAGLHVWPPCSPAQPSHCCRSPPDSVLQWRRWGPTVLPATRLRGPEAT